MNATVIMSLVVSLVQNFPAVQKGLRELFAKKDPTPEDWDELRAKVLAKKYEDFVPATQLPKDPA